MTRNKSFVKNVLTCVLLLLGACGVDFAAGNGDGSGADAPFVATASYAGLGSFWTLAKSKDAFRITMQEDRQSSVAGTIEGVWQKLDNGFVRLRVQSGTGDFASVNSGLEVFGLEIPGFLFVLKVPGDDKLIYMPEVGACPTGTLVSNGLVMRPGAMNWNRGVVNHGLVHMYMDEGTGTAEPRAFGTDTSSPAGDLQRFPFTCEQGLVTIAPGTPEQSDGVITTSGVGVVGSSGGVMLIPGDTGVRAADLTGAFVGLVYNVQSGREEIQAVTLKLDRGSGTVQLLESAEGANSGSGFSLVATQMIEGSLPGGFVYSLEGYGARTGSGLGILLANRNLGGSGRMFLAASGQEPGGTAPYFLFAVRQ